MAWLNESLNRKFIAGTASGLFLSSLVFLALYISMYRNELAAERASAAASVNALLQTSLENAMLKRDLEGLRHIVRQLGRQSEINTVLITNPKGEIRFASDDALLGHSVPPASTMEAFDPGFTEFMDAENGTEVLRSVVPVKNRPACLECHGPAAVNPINGILYVDYDASIIRQQARDTTLLLMGSGSVIVVLNLLGGWWFIRRFVLQPVDQLNGASRRLSAGELSARVQLSGEDELARLGLSFNRMAEELASKIEALKDQETFLQGLVDAVPDGIRIIDNKGVVRRTNVAYRRQLGLGDKSGVGDFCYASSHGRSEPCAPTLVTCPLHEIGRVREPVKALHHHRRADGSHLEVEVYAAPMEATVDGEPQTLVVESIRDLAKQVQYSQEQKLSELGHLAAGIAHEIHNPLASVRMALHAANESIDERAAEEGELRDNLLLVDREIDKCIEVTEKLLRLSASPTKETELVDLSQVLDDVLSLLQWEAEKCDITIHRDYPSGLRVLATDSEMRMASLNLTQNAFHAMPHGGDLTVRAKRSGPQILIEFRDTGVGIDPADVKHIFDPFFSHRADNRRGTGLGLAITRNIVNTHGGDIDVQSELGRGSQFTMRFPDADALSEVEA